MYCLEKLIQVLAKFINKIFPKEFFKSALRKEQWLALLVEHLALNKNSAKMQCLSTFLEVSLETISETSPKTCFKALYERKNAQLLS